MRTGDWCVTCIDLVVAAVPNRLCGLRHVSFVLHFKGTVRADRLKREWPRSLSDSDSSLSRWDNMHSSIIHHAILLVLISPLFIVAGTVLTPLRGRASLVVPLMLLLLGAAGLFIGVQQAA